MAKEAPLSLEEVVAKAVNLFKARETETLSDGSERPYLLWQAIDDVVAEARANDVTGVELLLRWARESDVNAEELTRLSALSSVMPESADEFLQSLAANILEVVAERDPEIASLDSLRLEADFAGRS